MPKPDNIPTTSFLFGRSLYFQTVDRVVRLGVIRTGWQKSDRDVAVESNGSVGNGRSRGHGGYAFIRWPLERCRLHA